METINRLPKPTLTLPLLALGVLSLMTLAVIAALVSSVGPVLIWLCSKSFVHELLVV